MTEPDGPTEPTRIDDVAADDAYVDDLADRRDDHLHDPLSDLIKAWRDRVQRER